MDAASFVFLDETGATTNMVRRYGWGPKGERLVDAAPHGHWRTTTFIAGLRSTGIIAPLVLNGPMTGKAFLAYVEQFLAPALSPGDVVVMDNLAAHKVSGVREAIAAVSASILCLPPYSPDLNPSGAERLIRSRRDRRPRRRRRADVRQAQGALAGSRRTHP